MNTEDKIKKLVNLTRSKIEKATARAESDISGNVSQYVYDETKGFIRGLGYGWSLLLEAEKEVMSDMDEE